MGVLSLALNLGTMTSFLDSTFTAFTISSFVWYAMHTSLLDFREQGTLDAQLSAVVIEKAMMRFRCKGKKSLLSREPFEGSHFCWYCCCCIRNRPFKAPLNCYKLGYSVDLFCYSFQLWNILTVIYRCAMAPNKPRPYVRGANG